MRWTLCKDAHPEPHAHYVVRMKRQGSPLIFTASVCYGMHAPWWIPRTVDLFKPGAFVIPFEDEDGWLPAAEFFGDFK